MRHLAPLVLLVLLAVAPAAVDGRELPPSRPLTAKQAADAALLAFEAMDESALALLAGGDRPDPWLVADELCSRGEHAAAEAFARAAPRKAVARLPDYVTTRRGRGANMGARQALETAQRAIASRDAEAALAALDEKVPTDTLVGVRTAFWRGIALRALDRKEESCAAYVAAAEGAETLGWLDRAGRALDAAGRLQNALKHREEAIALFQRGLVVMEALEFPTGVAAILVNIGIVHHDRMDFARALSFYERALWPMEKSGHKRGLAETLLRIGLASNAISNFPKALGAYQRSLPLRRQLGDRAGWAGAQINIGNVYHSLCNYPRALEHYELGLDAARAIGHRQWIANGLINMAGVYRAVGNHALALDLAEKSLEEMKAGGAPSGMAYALNNLGIVYQDLGRLEQAATFYARALEAAQATGFKPAEASALQNLGRLRQQAGRYPEALEQYERARAIAESLGDRAGVAWNIAGIASVQIEMGQRKEGHAALRRAERDARMLRERELLVFCLRRQAAAHLDEGNAARAMSLAREGRAEVEHLLGGLGAEEASSGRMKHSFLFAVGALAAARMEDTAEAVTFLESGRAGALLEQLGGRDTQRWTDVPEALRRAEAEAKVAEAEARVAYGQALATGKLGVAREKAKALDAALAQVRSVAERIQREAKGQAADLFYPRAATIEEIQKQLQPDQALVLYGLSRGEAIAVVLTSKTDRVTSVGREADVNAACAALSLSDAGSDPAQELAALRKLLVKPLALPEGVKQVLVSPEGALCYLPFSLLFEQSVAFTPSGTTHALLTKEARFRGSSVLALGDPVYGENPDRAHAVYVRGRRLTPLPATRLEVQAIGDEVLLGAEANEKDLRAHLDGKARWRAVHFACHGLVDREHPTLSSLALSRAEGEDGFLTALEVLRMRIPADLVALSACETGTGRIVPGEGIVGLARTFMFAGAPRVLCSLWKVDDEATRALMVRFYELWHPKDGSRGLGAAAALQKAQAFVRSHDKWKHPYYWAAWVLWGLP